MVNANNKQSNGLISNAFGVAKKFSSTGLDLLNHVAPDSVTKALKPSNSDQVIDGSAKTKSAFQLKNMIILSKCFASIFQMSLVNFSGAALIP